MPVPAPVNLTVKLNPTRRRMVITFRRLLRIIGTSDAKLYARNPAVAFVPIFPNDDVALNAALTLVRDRLISLTPNSTVEG